MVGPVSSTQSAWCGNPSSAGTSLPGKDACAAKSADNSNAKKDLDQNKDRTLPTTQELASFVAQCRSGT